MASRSSGSARKSGTVLAILGALLLVQSAYLAVDSSPDVFYVGNVLLHAFGGLAIAIAVLVLAPRAIARISSAGARAASRVGLVCFTSSAVAAIVLGVVENVRPNRWILDVHIALAVIASLAALTALVLARHRMRGVVGLGAALALAVFAAASLRDGDARYRVVNPDRPPAVMADEAMGGDSGPFFPSSANTSTGGRIPSDFFMTSQSCARCHQDIYDQWNGSAHHFSSFNNQWYRKSIEYMQEVNSVQSSKWCAGCHDHAVLFNGVMDEPVETFIATEEAHTGLGCNSCHAITRVQDTMGNGGFFIEYPPLHDLAVSENPLLRGLHDLVLRLDPGPHRDTFLKPFHREQTAEFCASCHKVHLDVPVNNYRWIRGFNEYDNWQASGVSGHGARSFYYPAEPMDCADCHMPRVESDDKGNIAGMVHDHSFLAANTAVPSANLHEKQLANTIAFLQRNQVTVDIFAATPAVERVGQGDQPLAEVGAGTLSSTFAVGEEAAAPVGRPGGGAADRELEPIWGPLDADEVFEIRRGEEVRVDVVVRTRGVGHFFPGGTIDGFEVWLELRAEDETGRTIFWSGVAENGGRGEIDPGAQFYGVRMVDARGNPINKRNAWATRAVAWVNLIPPGAADVARYRLAIPEDCGDEITLEARLNYRKFAHELTEFSFAGIPADGEPAAPGAGIERVTRHHDDREFVTGSVPMNVSAVLREIPELPTVVVHRDTATLHVIDPGAEPTGLRARAQDEAPRPGDFGRWNDYGIGLLRQGDLQGARRAFGRVVAAAPDYADGFVNLARVALREGLVDDAEDALGHALALEPDLAKSHYFTGVVLKERGRYAEALASFRRAAEQYPRDRVVRNAIGRVLFLTREFEAAVEEFEAVLAIDPEDLTAHFNLMLCYRGLGRDADAERARTLYERFKADEDADAILGPYLRENPQDNRMRQPIHEQVSVSSDVIDREARIRAEGGEPTTVLPGEAETYAARVIARGRRLEAEGKKAARFRGPTERAAADARADTRGAAESDQANGGAR